MSQHTPGPWINDHRVILGRAFDGSHRNICDKVRGGTPEAADANARLIAAAPELLEALRNCITWIDKSDPDYESALISFERTIAKAEGKP